MHHRPPKLAVLRFIALVVLATLASARDHGKSKSMTATVLRCPPNSPSVLPLDIQSHFLENLCSCLGADGSDCVATGRLPTYKKGTMCTATRSCIADYVAQIPDAVSQGYTDPANQTLVWSLYQQAYAAYLHGTAAGTPFQLLLRQELCSVTAGSILRACDYLSVTASPFNGQPLVNILFYMTVSFPKVRTALELVTYNHYLMLQKALLDDVAHAFQLSPAEQRVVFVTDMSLPDATDGSGAWMNVGVEYDTPYTRSLWMRMRRTTRLYLPSTTNALMALPVDSTRQVPNVFKSATWTVYVQSDSDIITETVPVPPVSLNLADCFSDRKAIDHHDAYVSARLITLVAVAALSLLLFSVFRCRRLSASAGRTFRLRVEAIRGVNLALFMSVTLSQFANGVTDPLSICYSDDAVVSADCAAYRFTFDTIAIIAAAMAVFVVTALIAVYVYFYSASEEESVVTWLTRWALTMALGLLPWLVMPGYLALVGRPFSDGSCVNTELVQYATRLSITYVAIWSIIGALSFVEALRYQAASPGTCCRPVVCLLLWLAVLFGIGAGGWWNATTRVSPFTFLPIPCVVIFWTGEALKHCVLRNVEEPMAAVASTAPPPTTTPAVEGLAPPATSTLPTSVADVEMDVFV